MRLAARGHAASELEVEYEGRDASDDDVAAVWRAWERGDRCDLVFDLVDSEAVARGLCELSNRADDRAGDSAYGPDECRHARHAAQGLATLMRRARSAPSTLQAALRR